MFKKQDPYSFSCHEELFHGEDAIGTLRAEYQVLHYDNVQLDGAEAVHRSRRRTFLLLCTQRINIFNKNSVDLKPSGNLESYNNYPVIISTEMKIPSAAGLKLHLQEYSPETVNTKVQATGATSQSQGQTRGSSTNDTRGSSTSETNTYGTQVSYGTLSGASVSANFERSSTTSSEQSHSEMAEASASRGVESSQSASMSMKDWGAYAMVHSGTQSPVWTFGQEYPWDAIQCRRTDGQLNPHNDRQVRIDLPWAMASRLHDGTTVYPPSHLSTFGINFVMKAGWYVSIDDSQFKDENFGRVTISHAVHYYKGSHQRVEENKEISVAAYMDKDPSVLLIRGKHSLDTQVDLGLMALDPIGSHKAAAVVGFVPSKFTVMPERGTPTRKAVQFKIASVSNDLLIKDTTLYPEPSDDSQGAGFLASETSLTAHFAKSCTALRLILYFKVVDSSSNFTLFLKHWKTGKVGVELTLVVNGNSAAPLTKYVDSAEAGGGDNNLLAVALRDSNFASIDYHDYLQLGLNSIDLTLRPIGSHYVPDCGYQVRAISIEKD